MVHPNANLTHKPPALFVPLGLMQDLRSATPCRKASPAWYGRAC